MVEKEKPPAPKEKTQRKTYLDKDGHPTRSGVWLVKIPCNAAIGQEDEEVEIDVYRYKMKGLCCFSEDFGSSGAEGISDEHDCHVSVQFTGITFIRRLRDLFYYGRDQGAGITPPSKEERKMLREEAKKFRAKMIQ
jgi:hypothetical protein